ncbi:uncharacterized protein [Dermacentor albipictus]|uniref:uncharacterized protein isoform X1 n=1 Tax=Dermacentor albipictus TaxID=60249 RepID=UPI0038FD2E70
MHPLLVVKIHPVLWRLQLSCRDCGNNAWRKEMPSRCPRKTERSGGTRARTWMGARDERRKMQRAATRPTRAAAMLHQCHLQLRKDSCRFRPLYLAACPEHGTGRQTIQQEMIELRWLQLQAASTRKKQQRSGVATPSPLPPAWPIGGG